MTAATSAGAADTAVVADGDGGGGFAVAFYKRTSMTCETFVLTVCTSLAMHTAAVCEPPAPTMAVVQGFVLDQLGQSVSNVVHLTVSMLPGPIEP